MANRNYPSARIFGWHLMPIRLDAKITIGSSGAPTLTKSATNGVGLASISRLTTGIYQVQLSDNFATLLQLDCKFRAPVSGGAVNMGSLSTGTIYQIVTLGTSTQAQWVTAGVPAGITAAPNVVFKAAGAGAGNGTVKILGNSGIAFAEALGQSSLMLNNQPFQANAGGYVTFQTMGPSLTMNSYTPAGVITNGTPDTFAGTPATLTGAVSYIPTDPTSGSIMELTMVLNNSQVG